MLVYKGNILLVYKGNILLVYKGNILFVYEGNIMSIYKVNSLHACCSAISFPFHLIRIVAKFMGTFMFSPLYQRARKGKIPLQTSCSLAATTISVKLHKLLYCVSLKLDESMCWYFCTIFGMLRSAFLVFMREIYQN